MKKMALALLVSLPLLASAQAKKGNKESLHDQFSGQGYGMAGCGLGSIVFGPKPGMIQIVAATLNATGYQTIAITFGTSNCSEGAVIGKTNQFIETNKTALENDIVRGQGETIAALSEVMECQDASFGASMKQNYVSTFPNGGASAEQLSALAFKACAN